MLDGFLDEMKASYWNPLMLVKGVLSFFHFSLEHLNSMLIIGIMSLAPFLDLPRVMLDRHSVCRSYSLRGLHFMPVLIC